MSTVTEFAMTPARTTAGSGVMRPILFLMAAGLCGAVLAQDDADEHAADADAGAELAGQCIACHGTAGVSTSGEYPNLAAQKSDYLEAQLMAFRAGERSNALMNAIAASLSDADIRNLAAHFSGLAGAVAGAVAEDKSGLDAMLPSFPESFEEEFTRYQTIEFEDRQQVRHYWANESALQAAKSGGDFPDGAYLLVEILGAETDEEGRVVKSDDGAMVPTARAAFTAMEKQSGWGEDVPEVLKNGDWRYAVFSVEGAHREGVNEAGCLACHKPLTDTDYTFTYDAMASFEK